MNHELTPIGEEFLREILLGYHIFEEILIGTVCVFITLRAFRSMKYENLSVEQHGRVFLFFGAFLVLGLSSTIHATVHALKLDLNLLYQTLIGYCYGLLLLVTALSSARPQRRKLLPFGYFLLLPFFLPSVYKGLPYFDEFRPLVWILIAYLSAIVCMIYIGTFYRTRNRHFLFSATGHLFICLGAMFLFFPSRIGSPMWFYGHLFRPLGFMVLFFSVTRRELLSIGGSILYRSLTAFSLLAGIPLVVFGATVFYENIHPVNILNKKMLVFVLFIVTLVSALLFGLGLIIRLIKPIIGLRTSVEQLSEAGFQRKVPVNSTDEVGQLAETFNNMVDRLNVLMKEQDRLSRLAATGQLAATLAHEIKNPLNAIAGAVSYLKENFHGELLREFLEIIAQEVKRINKLTTSLLSFARPLNLQRQWTDLNRLVQETTELLSREAAQNGVTLRVQLSEQVPALYCDPNQVKQVIINLLLNAFDATNGKGEVMIKTEKQGAKAVISVTDNGSGIAPDVLGEIFNPFFTTKTRGTGLGLAISKSIVNEHGGDIIVESTPGRGSTFKVLLPIQETP